MYNVCAVQWTHNSCTHTPERIAHERRVECTHTRTHACTYPHTHTFSTFPSTYTVTYTEWSQTHLRSDTCRRIPLCKKLHGGKCTKCGTSRVRGGSLQYAYLDSRQYRIHTHTAMCSSGTYSLGAVHSSTGRSVTPFTVTECEEEVLSRHWTSDIRHVGTPDTSPAPMWGFSESPLHKHRVSAKPQEASEVIHG